MPQKPNSLDQEDIEELYKALIYIAQEEDEQKIDITINLTSKDEGKKKQWKVLVCRLHCSEQAKRGQV